MDFRRWSVYGPKGVPVAEGFRSAFHGGEFRLLAALRLLGPWTLDAPSPEERLYKLVVYVPEAQADAVREAVCRAGAGHIGLYSDCTFSVRGEGTFRAGPFARPFLGDPGQLERVAEVRLETVVAASCIDSVLEAMRRAHPYEEIAYDLIPLANPQQLVGHGRRVRLAEEVSAAEIVGRLASLGLRAEAELPSKARRVVVLDLEAARTSEEEAIVIARQGTPDVRLEAFSYRRWEETTMQSVARMLEADEWDAI